MASVIASTWRYARMGISLLIWWRESPWVKGRWGVPRPYLSFVDIGMREAVKEAGYRAWPFIVILIP